MTIIYEFDSLAVYRVVALFFPRFSLYIGFSHAVYRVL